LKPTTIKQYKAFCHSCPELKFVIDRLIFWSKNPHQSHIAPRRFSRLRSKLASAGSNPSLYGQ